MSDYISKSAVTKVLEDCHLDKELFEKDVFDSINALPTLDEKEIIRKAFERVLERLEEGKTFYKMRSLDQDEIEVGAFIEAIDIVKEEGGIE